MNSPQKSGRKYLAAALLGAMLALTFTAQPTLAASVQVATGHSVAYSSATPGQHFMANGTGIKVNGTLTYNFLGTGGNDTFSLFGGNVSSVFVATGLFNNNFSIITGNPSTGTNASTFSLVSGDFSSFDIVQNNANGTVTMIIVAGTNSNVNMSSIGPVGNTILSISLGTNSSTSIASQFAGTTLLSRPWVPMTTLSM